MLRSRSKEQLLERDYGISGEMAHQAESTSGKGETQRGAKLTQIGRSPEDVTERLDRVIGDIRSRFHEKMIGKSKGEAKPCDVLVVAHGHILRAFAMRWIKRKLTEGVSLLLEGNLMPQSSKRKLNS